MLSWLSLMEINVRFEEKLGGNPPPEVWLKSIVETALLSEKADPTSEVSLLIAGQERVHELNRTYLDEDHPTDVLSFPMTPSGGRRDEFVSAPDGIRHLGDVIVSLPQATVQAREHGHSGDREIAILIIHGVLHLLGYDHDEPEREQSMRTRELEILGLLRSSEHSVARRPR